MSKAIVVIFHNNSYNHSPMWRILWDYFKLELLEWKGTFDRLYLIDNGFGFKDEDIDFLRLNKINYHVMKISGEIIEEGLNRIFEKVTEDAFLLIHSDTFIYNPTFIEENFKDLEEYNVATIFDGSGKKLDFPLFKENELRGERVRFCNYLWFGRTEDLRKINPDWAATPAYPECASYITEQLLNLGIKVKELRDDRSNILYDGTKTQWSDSPDKEWGRDYPLRLGYYHVRNFSNGLELVNDFYENKESYTRRKTIMPLNEILRILAWEKTIAEKVQATFEISEVLQDLQVPLIKWEEYLKEFKKFHNYE